MSSQSRVIELTQGYVAIIDAEDYRKVNRHSWRVHRSAGKDKKLGEPYARACIKGKNVYLHRFVMNAQPGMVVDHKNHQTLDCRKCNLEEVDHTTNQQRRRNAIAKRKRICDTLSPSAGQDDFSDQPRTTGTI